MNSYYCIKCGADRPADDSLPCLACGAYGKKVVSGPVKIVGSAHVSAKGIPTFISWETNKLRCAIVVAITIGAPFVGLFLAQLPGLIVGLFLSVLSFFVGLKARTKIMKQIHRE